MNLLVFTGVVGIFIIGQMIIGLRWWFLLKSQSVFISLWAAVRLHFLGLFYNNFMPSSVGGDLIRAWYVTKHTSNRFNAVLSVFVDRAIGLLSTLVIAVFFYMLFLWGKSVVTTSKEQSTVSLVWYVTEYKEIILLIMVILTAVSLGFLLTERGRVTLKRVVDSIRIHSVRLIVKFKNVIVIYCSKPQVILTVFCLTVLMQLMVITSFWLLGVNMGIEANIKYYYVFFTLAWMLSAIPISIGGAGVLEGSLVLLFVQIAGIDETSAWAIALSQRAVWMIASLPGALIYLIGAHLPKDQLAMMGEI
jgi:uncharacterized protein (TIRG00374 family)